MGPGAKRPGFWSLYGSYAKGVALRGYDFGYYESEYGKYSCIFHEVVYGMHAEMRGFGNRLNENLLMKEKRDGKDLAGVRKHLLETGADLEGDLGGDPEPSIIAVYGRRRN